MPCMRLRPQEKTLTVSQIDIPSDIAAIMAIAVIDLFEKNQFPLPLQLRDHMLV